MAPSGRGSSARLQDKHQGLRREPIEEVAGRRRDVDPERYIVETQDRDGRTVRYARSNYERHLARHPETRGAAEAIEKTIRDPDVSITADNQHRYLYRRGLGAGKFARAWLLVIILYTRDGERTEGVVKTAYFTSRISAEGKIEWTRWGS